MFTNNIMPKSFFELHSELILSQIGNDCVSLYSRSFYSWMNELLNEEYILWCFRKHS